MMNEFNVDENDPFYGSLRKMPMIGNEFKVI